MIQVFSNSLGAEELRAVSDLFASHWIGKGRECDAFEREFAAHLGTDHVLMTNNCTASIYIALRALGIEPGDEVIVSTINFVACANAVIELGAKPVFADVDPRALNILPSEIDRLQTPRTRAVIVLHYGGHPAPLGEIDAAHRGYVAIIEDAANAVASTYHGVACGTLGDAGVWSFDAMKILCTLDGGVLWLRDAKDNPFDWEEDARSVRATATALRYLGLAPKTTSGMDAMGEKQARWWEYELVDVSGRFISNDVSAAIGRIQLRKLPAFIARRKAIWERYQAEFAPLVKSGPDHDGDWFYCPPEPLPDCTSSYYLYWLQVPERDRLARYLADNGVYTTFRYFPLHKVAYYRSKQRLHNAEWANKTTLNLPIHQNLTDDEVGKVIELVKRFYGEGK